jgi:hypothetical protein
VRSQVQLLLGPPFKGAALLKLVRGFSSAGRAPALQAGGQRFEPVKLHQFSFPEMKTTVSNAVNAVLGFGGFAAVL